MLDQKETLITKEDFETFKKNDFFHLVKDVSTIKGKVNYILGALLVLVPLVFAVLGMALIMIGGK